MKKDFGCVIIKFSCNFLPCRLRISCPFWRLITIYPNERETLTPLLSTSLHAVRALSPYQDLRCLNPTANNNTSQVTNRCIRSYFKRGLTNKSLLALIVMLTSAQVVETSVTSIELPTIAQVFQNFPQLGDCTTPPTISRV